MKKIVFQGKRAIDSFTVKEKRIRINAIEDEPNIQEQLELLDGILLLGDILSNSNESTRSLMHIVNRDINTKINGYKQQDIRKCLYDKNKLVTNNQVISKLIDCKLVCTYCKEELKVLYKQVRDPKQWTLDRVDNDICHSNINTVIACLSCNLKRRRMSKEVFETTRNIIVTKV